MESLRTKFTIRNELVKAAVGEFLGTDILVVSFVATSYYSECIEFLRKVGVWLISESCCSKSIRF